MIHLSYSLTLRVLSYPISFFMTSLLSFFMTSLLRGKEIVQKILLYSNPKMKVYIENSKVQTRILEQTLYSSTSYTYITKGKVKLLLNLLIAQ